MRLEDSDMASRPALPESDGQFARRVLILAGIAALAALLWMLSEILLLVFASALLAVILRSVAALFSAHAGVRPNWSLAAAGLLIAGLLAAAIYLFGAQLRAQLEVLTSQLQAVEQTVSRYFDIGSVKELLSGSSLGAMFARALSWGTTAIAVVASLVLVIVGGIYMAIDPDVYRDGLTKLFPLNGIPRSGPLLMMLARRCGCGLERR